MFVTIGFNDVKSRKCYGKYPIVKKSGKKERQLGNAIVKFYQAVTHEKLIDKNSVRFFFGHSRLPSGRSLFRITGLNENIKFWSHVFPARESLRVT